MNPRFSALLIANLAGLMLSGQVLAEPRFMERDFRDFSVREDRTERDFGKWQEREVNKSPKQPEKKAGRKSDEEQERGYGYGYERRNPQPRQDDRGRR